jgi:RNA polymerase-binding transcription factor DksA
MSDSTVKSRYSDRELLEFKQLILEKLAKAREQLNFYLRQLSDMADNPDAKVKNLEDGIGSHEREQIAQLAARQKSLIVHLENALFRIESKVYGVCRVTGRLISKERLRAVPHATLSIEAKRREVA